MNDEKITVAAAFFIPGTGLILNVPKREAREAGQGNFNA